MADAEDGVTLVFPYYNNETTLAFHCGNWFSYADDVKEQIKVIVVDDGSPKKPAYPILRKMRIGMDIRLFRVKEDIGWNCIGCKNLGMQHVGTKWVVLLDIDHLVDEQTWRWILQNKDKLDPQKVYMFERFWPDGRNVGKAHADSWLLTKKLYWDLGGYDEDFSFKMGGSHIVNVIGRATGGRLLLPSPARTVLVQSILPDGATPVTKEQQDEGRRHRSEVYMKKKAGELPAKPTDYCRFEWERQI